MTFYCEPCLSMDSTHSWQESKAISQFSPYKPTQKLLCLLLVLPVSWIRQTYFSCPWSLVLFPCNHAEVMAKAIKIIKAINLSGDAWEPSLVISSGFTVFKHCFDAVTLAVNPDRAFLLRQRTLTDTKVRLLVCLDICVSRKQLG